MYYHESFAHVVWLGDAVVAFRVLAEAEEDGVDGHLVLDIFEKLMCLPTSWSKHKLFCGTDYEVDDTF